MFSPLILFFLSNSNHYISNINFIVNQLFGHLNFILNPLFLLQQRPPPTNYNAYPAFTEPPGLQAAHARNLNPPYLRGRQVAYEHHVGSWATTKIAQHFTLDKWLITPEQALPAANTLGGADLVKTRYRRRRGIPG